MTDDRIDTLERQVAEKDDRIADLEDEVDGLRTELTAKDNRIDALEEHVADLEDELDAIQHHSGKDRAELKARVSTLEDTTEAVADVTENGPDPDALEQDDVTPLEQVAALPDPVADEQLNNQAHRNTYRARSIFVDWFDYSSKTPEGHRITGPEIVRIINAQEDGTIESKTAERICRRLADWSDDRITHLEPDDRDAGERAVYLEPDEFTTIGTAQSDGAVREEV